jgi:3',5'-cyclic AMP phosphodiesterase CpdA
MKPQILSKLFFRVIILIIIREICMPAGVIAQPDLIHLSLGTKRRFETTSPVIVTWCSQKNSGKQYVRYGPTPETLFTVKAKKGEFEDMLVLHGDLKKLKGGTKYYYRCGSDEVGWSRVYSFTSEPDSGSIRIGILADTQNNTNNDDFERTRQLAALLQIYSPMFTLHMGDLVNNGSLSDNWVKLLEVTQDLNAVSPLMPVLGNHDIQNEPGKDFQKPFQNFYSLFDLPGDKVNYSFTYDNTRFIGIFSGYAETAAKVGDVEYNPGSPEYKWLDNELTRAEKDKDIRWIILWMHYPVYSYGWSNIKGWRENLLPLISKHRVDLCLAGHRHVYERHWQMKNGMPAENNSGSVYSAGKGTLYITNGTSGGNPTGLGGQDMVSMAFTPDRTMYNFAVMDINDRSLNYRVFDQENVLIDNFTIKK